MCPPFGSLSGQRGTRSLKCKSHEDLVQLRNALLSGNLRSAQLGVSYTVSAQPTEEMQYLEKTIGLIDEGLRRDLELRLEINEQSVYEVQQVLAFISRLSYQVRRFILVLDKQSHGDVFGIVNGLKECRLCCFALSHTNIHGHVAHLAPLFTPSLKEFCLSSCGLVNDDIPDLINILSAGHEMERLCLDGNTFSVDGVKALTNYLHQFPKLTTLSLDNIDLDENLVKHLVWQTLPVIRCSSFLELAQLRNVLLDGKIASTRLKQINHTISTHGTKEMLHLEETLGLMDEKLRGQLNLRIDIDEKSSFNAECVSECISRMSHQVGTLIFVMDKRSYQDVISIVSSLKTSRLYCFGLHDTNMHGHVGALAPLFTPSFNELQLNTCGLVDDDIPDLISVLPDGHGMEVLYLDGNSFSLNASEILVAHLGSFPKLTILSLRSGGLDACLLKRLVWQILPIIECGSYADLTVLRDVLLGGEKTSMRLKRVIHAVSTEGTKEMQHLEETLGRMDERLRGRLTLRIDIDEETSSFDAESVPKYISRMSHQVGTFVLVMKRRSPQEVISTVKGLKESRLYGFGLHHINMHGHVAKLAPLAIPLQELHLKTCGLVDDDITDLINILPAGHGTQELYLDGNSFSLDTVKILTDHLRKFPNLIILSLESIGLDEGLVKRLVWQIVPGIQICSYANLTLLRDVLLDGKMTSARLRKIFYAISTQGMKEMQHLEETLEQMDETLRGQLTLRIDIDEKSSFDAKSVSEHIFRISHQVGTFVLKMVRRSPQDVISTVDALKASPLYCFGLQCTNMHGHVAALAPLFTPSLNELHLTTCGLLDDDMRTLIQILPAGHGLKKLYLDGNSFSVNAVMALTDYIRNFPNLTTVSLVDIGLDEDLVQGLVWQVIAVNQHNPYTKVTVMGNAVIKEKMTSTGMQITYSMSTQGAKEMQLLEKKLGQLDARLRGRLQLRILVNEKSSFDTDCVSDCISRMTRQVGSLILLISGRSHSDINIIASGLKDCRTDGFLLFQTNMSGHVTDVAPLVTPSLEVLHLNACGLVDEDFTKLMSILVSGHGLKMLSLDGNSFSLEAVKAHADFLRDLPKLSVLSFDDMGFDENLIKLLTWKILSSASCNSYEDLRLLRDTLTSGNLEGDRIRKVWYTMSAEGPKEMQHLEETLGLIDEGIRGQVQLKLDINERSLFDPGFVSKWIFRMVGQVKSFTLTMNGRTRHEVMSIVNALKGCRLYSFNVFHTNMRGHLSHLAPIVTQSLKDMGICQCNLIDEDVTDLISILPSGHGLEELDFTDNAFSPEAVEALTEHLRGSPGLAICSLVRNGLDEDLVKRLTWRIVSYIQCNSYEDLMLLREVLLSGKKAPHPTQIICIMSDQGNREMEHLADTLALTDKKLLDVLHIRVDINEKSMFDVACMSGCISRMSGQGGKVTILLRRRAHHDVVDIVNALKECNLYGFGIRYVNLHGRVNDLAPLVTPALKHLEVVACQLADDDVSNMISILPAGHGLEKLDMDGNAFSSDAVETLTEHLRGFPQLAKRSIDKFGRGEDLLKKYQW